MSYFQEEGRGQYVGPNQKSFRLTYNKNSGGGQIFFSGKFADENGRFHSPSELDGYKVMFRIEVGKGETTSAVTLDDSSGIYEVKPRATNSKDMKLGVQGKTNPSRLLAAFLMLPATCTVRNPKNIGDSILSRENYWIQSLELEVPEYASQTHTGPLHLICKEFIFSGGIEKNGDIKNQRNFRLNIDKRIEDIIGLSERAKLPDPFKKIVDKFALIYQGLDTFDFKLAETSIAELMSALSDAQPEYYSGTTDPLSALFALEKMPIVVGNDSVILSNSSAELFSRNRIVFGAPGTGKSHLLEQECDELLCEGGFHERVTFHPEYSHAQFVGTYKPVPVLDNNGVESISYRFVPGPFMRVLVEALRGIKIGSPTPCVLLIEEINRANTAAVFGDVFQLLDRATSNESQYSITPSKDVRDYLIGELGGEPEHFNELRIPHNMYLWATMNSADQGVFPLDTAFKRRWEFKYIGINENDAELHGKTTQVGTGIDQQTIEWNVLRRSINDFLADRGINEDKQMGPYFLERKVVVPSSGETIDSEAFTEAFCNKVLTYLFEDAGRQIRKSLFDGIQGSVMRYSDIVSEFRSRGVQIFNGEINRRLEENDILTTQRTSEEEMLEPNRSTAVERETP